MTAISWFFHFAFGPDAGDIPPNSGPRSSSTPVPADQGPSIRTAGHLALVERIRSGDEAAFETLFREFYAPLCDYVEILGHSADAAEDIVEELFLKLWSSRVNWTVRGSVASYLYVAARHQASNAMTHRHTAERMATRASIERTPVSAPDAEQTLAASDYVTVVQRTVAALPSRSRQIFLLYYRDGLSQPEIAEQLGVARKTVENQLARALKVLATRLRQRLR